MAAMTPPGSAAVGVSGDVDLAAAVKAHLVAEEGAAARELYHACFVVLSHDSSADPLLNYANAAGLSLFELSWTELIGMPSRLTAEIPEQDQRARFLTEVSRAGFIANYRGVRIGKTGRRFAIEGATVWNLLAEDGSLCGQAATFDRWTFLEA